MVKALTEILDMTAYEERNDFESGWMGIYSTINHKLVPSRCCKGHKYYLLLHFLMFSALYLLV